MVATASAAFTAPVAAPVVISRLPYQQHRAVNIQSALAQEVLSDAAIPVPGEQEVHHIFPDLIPVPLHAH